MADRALTLNCQPAGGALHFASGGSRYVGDTDGNCFPHHLPNFFPKVILPTKVGVQRPQFNFTFPLFNYWTSCPAKLPKKAKLPPKF
jgi:hypothetical protein